MTGPEHYREAESLLITAEECVSESVDLPHLLAAAQVHATLALAAATAATPVNHWLGADDTSGRAWTEVV